MSEENIRCPVQTCSGWVCEVEDSPNSFFWGCGECGTVWWQKSELDQAISDIIRKYPYRSKCYLDSGSGWSAQPLEQEEPGYEEKVHHEWND